MIPEHVVELRALIVERDFGVGSRLGGRGTGISDRWLGSRRIALQRVLLGRRAGPGVDGILCGCLQWARNRLLLGGQLPCCTLLFHRDGDHRADRFVLFLVRWELLAKLTGRFFELTHELLLGELMGLRLPERVEMALQGILPPGLLGFEVGRKLGLDLLLSGLLGWFLFGFRLRVQLANYRLIGRIFLWPGRRLGGHRRAGFCVAVNRGPGD